MSRRVLLCLALSLSPAALTSLGCGSAPANVTPPEMTPEQIEEENRRAAEEARRQPR